MLLYLIVLNSANTATSPAPHPNYAWLVGPTWLETHLFHPPQQVMWLYMSSTFHLGTTRPCFLVSMLQTFQQKPALHISYKAKKSCCASVPTECCLHRCIRAMILQPRNLSHTTVYLTTYTNDGQTATRTTRTTCGPLTYNV